MTDADTTKPEYEAITKTLKAYRIIASGDEFVLEHQTPDTEKGTPGTPSSGRSVAITPMSSGRLHKSALHKSALHKSLQHKSLHKAMVGQGVDVGGSGLNWPSIEVPWR